MVPGVALVEELRVDDSFWSTLKASGRESPSKVRMRLASAEDGGVR